MVMELSCLSSLSLAENHRESQSLKLIVSGMRHSEKPQFKHLWGRYILGFKPAKHCIQCFKSTVAKGIAPNMSNDECELDPSYELFYLCGVGWKDRGNTNVHLAVTPRLGSIASIGSVYGVRFTILDAQAILIQFLPENWRDLPEAHRRCKNFQFGYQMFAADEVGSAAEGQLITTLRSGRPLRRPTV
jgi:hypothetical protein